MSSVQSPCLNCNRRHIGCYSDCEQYIKFRKDKDTENSLIRSKKKKISQIDEYVAYAGKCMRNNRKGR